MKCNRNSHQQFNLEFSILLCKRFAAERFSDAFRVNRPISCCVSCSNSPMTRCIFSTLPTAIFTQSNDFNLRSFPGGLDGCQVVLSL